VIGFDKPVRPEWIHAVGLAWRPHQPATDLIGVVDQVTAAQFSGPETRRKVATIILRYFVETVGGGPDRHTADQDLFAAAASKFSADELRSVYLSHLINCTPILQTITAEIRKRYTLGDQIQSSDFLHRVYEQYGQRGVVTNCVRHFLRTLSWFDCFERLAPNHYRFKARLPVSDQLFPLLVYSWFLNGPGGYHLVPSHFPDHIPFYFLDTTQFSSHLLAFNGVFWVVEKRLDADRVTLKYTSSETFQQALLVELQSELECATPERHRRQERFDPHHS